MIKTLSLIIFIGLSLILAFLVSLEIIIRAQFNTFDLFILEINSLVAAAVLNALINMEKEKHGQGSSEEQTLP